MKLSPHFSRHEFKCKCGTCDCSTVDAQLLELLEDIRTHYNAPIRINSAHRCLDHNLSVGGASYSYHLQGKAADIVVAGVSPAVVADYVDNEYPDSLGLGRYSNFTHIDVRDTRARWIG